MPLAYAEPFLLALRHRAGGWAKHPNPNAYLHINVRFMKAAAESA
jgi:hypothetical protein